MKTLGSIVTYKKGKPPKTSPHGRLPVLSPHYLRTGQIEDMAEPTSKDVVLKGGELILLWDGSNAGEFFRARAGVLSSTMVAFDFDLEETNPDYLYYDLKRFEPELKGRTAGSGIPHVDKEVLLARGIFEGGPDEQKAAAKVLLKVDLAIEQTEALLAKQQRIKTGLMHDLLTRGLDAQGRLRNPSTHSFKPSRYGPIPEEWDVSPASALCDAVIDCKNRTPPSTPSGHPVIRTPNVRNGRFVYEDLALTDTDSYEVWVSRGKPRIGDVVITREAPYGEACQIPADIPAACLGQRMIMYQPNPTKLRGDYLVYAIYSRAVQSRLLELAGGSTVGHIRVGDVRTLPLPHPRSTVEQGDICVALNSLSSIDTETVSSLRKLTKLKGGLMRDLLTGVVPITPLLSNPNQPLRSEYSS